MSENLSESPRSEHIPEPWYADLDDRDLGDDVPISAPGPGGAYIGTFNAFWPCADRPQEEDEAQGIANAQRAVACVNACAGLSLADLGMLSALPEGELACLLRKLSLAADALHRIPGPGPS